MNNKYLKLAVMTLSLAVTFFLAHNVQAETYSANMPSVYEEPGGASARGGDSSFGVESIDPFTGALKIVATDLVIPSNGGLDLKVVRNYQSFVKLQNSIPFRDYQAGRTVTGIGWDLHFGRLWKAGADGVAPQLAAANDTACKSSGSAQTTNRNNPVLELPDGSRQRFSLGDASDPNNLNLSNYVFISPQRWILRCLPTSLNLNATSTYGGDGGAIVISPDGVKYTFNFFHNVSNANVSTNTRDTNSGTAYHVTRIDHPNGTYIKINYLSKASTYFATLDTVQHSEGQSISFSYVGSNSPTNSASAVHLQSFTQVGTGRTWTFNYLSAVGSGITNPGPYEYLDSVVRPDGRKTSYEYVGKISSTASVDGQFSLRHVVTPLGGEIFYYYGNKTFPTRDGPWAVQPKYVITKKEVKRGAPSLSGTISNGITDTWTYNYRPSTTSAVESDFTDVSGPTSCTTYEHFSPNTAGNGWKVGSLLSKSISSPNTSALTCSATVLQKETNTWVTDMVTGQPSFLYPNPSLPNDPTVDVVDIDTFSPRLSQRVITREASDYTASYNDPDVFGNPQKIVETGRTTFSNGATGSTSRTTNYTYFTNMAAWILHRAKNETVINAGPVYATPTSASVISDYSVVRSFFTSGTKLGLLQSESRAGVATTYDYYTAANNGGTLSLITDANGFATTFSSAYKRGTPTVTTRSIDGTNSLVINRSVNDSGTLASQQDGEFKQTGYSYNGLNQLTGVTTARTDDSDISITRTATGSTSDSITRGAYKEIRQYDGFGTQVRTDWSDTTPGTAIQPIFQRTDFDAESRVIRQYLPNSTSSYVKTDYDALNRPIKITQPDGSTIQYDYLGNNQTCVTDERGFKTLYGYRSFGDPSQQEVVRIRADLADSPGSNVNTCQGSGAFQVTYIDRNLIGQVLSIVQDDGAGTNKVTRTYKYNSKFFLFEENHPEVGTIAYTHDNVGNVRTRNVGTSGTTSYTLDRLYRTDFVAYPDGSIVDFDYYKNDRLKFVTKTGTRWDYLYDANNNLQQEKLTLTASAPSIPVARTYQFDYGYDGRDAHQTVAYPSGMQLNYAPDVFGRPTTISATQSGSAITGFASSAAYYPNGQLSSITLPNGLTTGYGQDGRLRLSSFTTSGVINGSTQQLVNRLYEYDTTNNVSKINDYLAGSNTKAMTYDGLGRLRTANGAWGGGAVTYYSNNNIATKSFGTDSLIFNYDGSNKLSSITGTTPLSFGYDIYGNATSTGRSTFGNYQFDDESLLRYVRNADGTTKIEYVHDGNRHTAVERYVDGWSTKYKAYAGGSLLYEEDVANNIAKDYVYLGSRLIATRSRCTSTQDSDSDGVSDCLEFQNGLNKNNAADAGQDADNDGVSNAIEIQLGLNVYAADTDGDGLSDGYERSHGLNALVSDSNVDTDGDGLTNLQEAQLGTNPLKVDTDGDGIPDNLDPKPLFNPAWLIPIFNMLLE